MLKKWVSGRECEVRRERDVLEAAQALGLLHQRMDWGEILGDGAWTKEKMQEMIPQASDHEPVLEIELKPFAGRDMLSELRRHNRELKKVRAFIRSRVTKNEFERRFLAHFERMYEMAQTVDGMLRISGIVQRQSKSRKADTRRL